MEAARPFPQLVAASAPSLICVPAQLPRAGGPLYTRGGGAYGSPPSRVHGSASIYGGDNPDLIRQPPIGEVVGAGAVGALAGHLVFQSLLISVGLGVTVMGVAASSSGGAGQVARSSGRVAVAVFDRTAMFNQRFQVTDRVVEGARVAGCLLKEFDEEHAVVHRATQGAKKAWLGFRQYDEAHGLTARASGALTSGLDKLTEALTPPPPNTAAGNRSRRSRSAASRRGRGSSTSRRSRNNNNSSRSWPFGDNSTKSTQGFGAAAAAALKRRGGGGGGGGGGGEGAGAWPSFRDGLVNQESASARSWPGGAWGEEGGSGSGSGSSRRTGHTDAEEGRRPGTHTHASSSRSSRAPSPPSSWRVVWGDDDVSEI